MAGQDSGEWEEEEESGRSVFSSSTQHAARSTQDLQPSSSSSTWAVGSSRERLLPEFAWSRGSPGRETPPAVPSRAGTMEPLGGLRQLQLPAPATGPVEDRGGAVG
jgi:hypothetical protein